MFRILLILTILLTSVNASVTTKKGVVRECYGKIDVFLQKFADTYSQPLIITEAMDTIGRTNHSFHKIKCGARDIRIWNLSKYIRKQLVKLAREAHFFAVNEGNHIHIDIGGMKSKEDRLKILERHK